MNTFKGVSGGRRKRKSKRLNVEIKQEPTIKEELNSDDDVMNIPRPRFDGRYRTNYEGPFDFGYDFDEVKDEIKCEKEEKETGKEKDSALCRRSNKSAANDEDNEELMGDEIDVRSPQPVGSGKKQKEGFRRRNKRTIPRNQAAKKQKKHKCHVCNHLACGKYALKIHLRIHTGEKPFECSIFSKSFARNAHLRRHSMTHKDELPNACSKCARRFATPDEKQKHETRCQRSLFACNQCHYKTVQKGHLKRHVQSNYGAKRSIKCEFCRNEFTKKFFLNQHLSSTHSDQYPFKCSKCFGGYATEDAKEGHEHSCGYRQYQCHLCKNYRRYKHHLETHMRKVHTRERIQSRGKVLDLYNSSNAI
ncbi:zinc finger and BTB domain-containing protein 41-like [Sitodiplosis mosellana]|uniref:zinc finger and BTB domain-containing protein 41-like n=1 Tax=Sitodiplosis mosellana TaxID=263140 RepID=UPI002444B41E|nr:zinc finger and BTB domain-containing protein 41-like [Sitodiplosis mosellana]